MNAVLTITQCRDQKECAAHQRSHRNSIVKWLWNHGHSSAQYSLGVFQAPLRQAGRGQGEVVDTTYKIVCIIKTKYDAFPGNGRHYIQDSMYHGGRDMIQSLDRVLHPLCVLGETWKLTGVEKVNRMRG